MWILTVPTLLCSFAMIILVVDLFTHELHHWTQVVQARICISYNMPKMDTRPECRDIVPSGLVSINHNIPIRHVLIDL